MQAADVHKLKEAVNLSNSIEGQIKIVIGRGAKAGQFWASWITDDRPATEAAHMKRALMFLKQMVKDAKSVNADLDKAIRAANDKKQQDKYATAKEYRDKALAKQHTSLHAWHNNAVHFVEEMAKVSPGDKFVKVSPHPAVEESATFKAIENFLTYYGEMEKALAKLG